ncbi:MAG: glutathione S-transferase family protein [Sphingomonadaceae bacterium]|nr:glutathione S-transferase family protein [Sphingomonadaceae bacterium]
MSDFIVHAIPGSPFARAVMAVMAEKGAPYRLAALKPGEHKQPAHLARHPFGRMPAIEHGDFGLYETQAILRYIDRTWPTPPLTPAEPKAAARMDQAMAVADWYLFPGVASVIGFQRVVGPALLGLVPDEAACAAAMPAAHTVFAALADLLGDRPFFAGAVSLADFLLAAQINFLERAPEWAALTAERAALPRWLARMQARPSFAATTWERVAELAAAA